MTVRYTAIEGMEEPALRDVDHNAERWRDKIELRLDNRQVFFLFFGSAVVACMLFVLGVMSIFWMAVVAAAIFATFLSNGLGCRRWTPANRGQTGAFLHEHPRGQES